MSSEEKVNHPAHYKRGGIEAIDVIEAWDLGFNLGNAVKYIARARYKGSRQDWIDDLKKAAWYCSREAQLLESPMKTSATTSYNDTRLDS